MRRGGQRSGERHTRSSRRRPRSASEAFPRLLPSGWRTVSERYEFRRRRRILIRTRTALALALVLALAGCGGRSQQPPPRLATRDAVELVSLARQVARDAPGDGCAARREIAALSTRAH